MPLYVATGLLSYNDSAAMDIVRLRLQPFAAKLLHKELYLSRVRLARGCDQQCTFAADTGRGYTVVNSIA